MSSVEWLEPLAAARLGRPEQSTISVAAAGGGHTSALLTCPAPATGSSAAVANLLLQEFVAASRPSRGGLSRAVQIEVVRGVAAEPSLLASAVAPAPQQQQQRGEAAGQAPLAGPQQQQQPPQLVVRFTAAGGDAAAAERVAAVASAFEAFLQVGVWRCCWGCTAVCTLSLL